MTEPADTDLEVLGEAECRALLQQGAIGRVAVTIGALPAIFPVNYGLIGGEVMFFSGDGTRMTAALSDAVVAFQTSQNNPSSRAGWSVQVIGIARAITDPLTVASAVAHGVQPWVRSDSSRLIVVRSGRITGRRLPAVDLAGSTPGR